MEPYVRHIDDSEYVDAIIENPADDARWKAYSRFLAEHQLFDEAALIGRDYDIIRRCSRMGAADARMVYRLAYETSPLAGQIINQLVVRLRQPQINATRKKASPPPLPWERLT